MYVCAGSKVLPEAKKKKKTQFCEGMYNELL